ncbi:Baseplate J family protein [Lysobacter dokdonensis DS-58]|uniref:Baseplate J family protein n=1 Tax=Lysobacter dokdonensis DS-58 TaxID=1300345 RepID=A0A0A2WKW8_9GAMM|nr:putative baseplate assembly protein [Lysobacter dokdonensis]KGQ19372.1 Baseplate J family protein [Lysobacter dokdonensis DS-58]
MSLEAKQPRFDRPFEEIFRELRDRIPLHNPAWTNYNDSDPGITLLQLFAWLAEMTLHKMGEVPRKNYLKFAELLGLELAAARPATVALAFTPKAAEIPQTIPERARFSGRGDAGTVAFETLQALDIIGAPIAAMFVFADGTVAKRDVPTQPQAAPFWPLGRTPMPGDALYLAFKPNPNNPRPFPRKMRFLALRPSEDTRGVAQRIGAHRDDLRPPVELAWEYRRSASQPDWERLAVLDDGSVALTRDGYIDVEGPQDIEPAIEPAVGTQLQGPHYWLRIRLDQDAYPIGRAPRLEHLLPNAVEAINLRTEDRRTLGTSAGRGEESFDFPRRPVDPDSLAIEVETPNAGIQDDWTRVDDFFDSKADSRHYVLNATAGRISFGDGERGQIPAAGAAIVAATWRQGGGAAGNSVAAGAVKTIETQVAGVEKVMNPRAATGGSEEQSLDDFIRNAPRQLLSGGRVVTARDFEVQAVAIQGVERARALGGRHPDYPGVEVPGAITVFIVADSEASPPAPSAELIRSVCQSLDKVRLITTEIYVAAPKFVEVRIEARLLAPPEAAFDQVAENTRKRLDAFLSPLERDFGEDLSTAALYASLIGAVDGDRQVRSVENLIVYVDGQEHDIRQPIALGPDALPFPGKHLIVVRPDPDQRVSR